MSVTFLVSFFTDRPNRAQVHAALLVLARRVLNEQNCLRFDVHTGKDDPGQFIVFQRWETRRDWQVFLNSPAMHAFLDICGGGLEDLLIKELTPHFNPADAPPALA